MENFSDFFRKKTQEIYFELGVEEEKPLKEMSAQEIMESERKQRKIYEILKEVYDCGVQRRFSAPEKSPDSIRIIKMKQSIIDYVLRVEADPDF